MESNKQKLVVGDLVRFSPSLIGLIHGFGYRRSKRDAEFYAVRKIGRRYYHLFSYDSETLGSRNREIFKVDMDLFDSFFELNPDLISVFHSSEGEYVHLHEQCIQDSIAKLNAIDKRATTQSSAYHDYRESFLELLRSFNSEQDNPLMAKVLLAI